MLVNAEIVEKCLFHLFAPILKTVLQQTHVDVLYWFEIEARLTRQLHTDTLKHSLLCDLVSLDSITKQAML